MAQENSPFYKIDFKEIDYQDPSLNEGHRVVYDRDIPTHIRYQDKFGELQDISIPETLNVRVLVLGPDQDPKQIRIEISSEKDLFFIFHHQVNEEQFKNLQLSLNLQSYFKDYPEICMISLNKCEPLSATKEFAALFTVYLDGTARFEILQTTAFKTTSMIYFDCFACSDEFIRLHIQYKHFQVRQSIKHLETRIDDIETLGNFKHHQ